MIWQILAAAHALLIALYLFGWLRLPRVSPPSPDYIPDLRLSVVVPARNEREHIGACIRSLLACDYPPELLEIVVVDDHSDDDTARIASHFLDRPQGPAVRLLRLQDALGPQAAGGSKKKALTLGIGRARGELIVTTDADCVFGRDWLRLLAFHWKKTGARALAAPALIREPQGLLGHFQALDLLGLMGVTGGGYALRWHALGNGANLAFPKAVFEAVEGYAGNEHRASGDDIFLLQKIANRYRGGIFFVKNADAAVQTHPLGDWAALQSQRLRWGGKNTAVESRPMQFALLIVWLHSVATCAAWAWVGAWGEGAGMGSGAWILPAEKALADGIFLAVLAVFFRRTKWLRYFPAAVLVHPFFTAWTGLLSLVARDYVWKGRRLR